MLISRNDTNPRRSQCITTRVVWVCGFATLFACSSARLDPKTRAVTFDTPSLSAATQPTSPSPETASAGAPTRSAPAAPDVQAESAHTDVTEASKAKDDASAAPKGDTVRCSRLPDPRPIVTDDWLRLTIRFDRGKLSLVGSSRERLRRARATARKMGRFAAELWIGCELIDRVRFDFPLLAAESGGAGTNGANTNGANTNGAPALGFERLGHYEVEIWVPNSERATRLEVRDRARDTDASAMTRLDWPLPDPNQPTQPRASDAAATKKQPQPDATRGDAAPSTPAPATTPR